MSGLAVLPTTAQASPVSVADLAVELQSELTEAHWELAVALLFAREMPLLEAALAGRHSDASSQTSLCLFTEEPVYQSPPFALELRQQAQDGQLTPEDAISSVWKGYFGLLADVAQASGNHFVDGFVSFEVPLRNALARFRADRVGVDPTGQLLAEPSAGWHHDELVSRFAEQTDPLEGERLLDSARLRAYELFGGTDPFSIDAVLCYLASAMVLERWRLPADTNMQQMLEVFL